MEPPMAWDAEDFKPPTIPSGMANAWDGEDEEENVKANWDDDDDDKKREDASKKQSQQSKKTTSRLLKKIEERERKEMEERARKKKLELEEEVDYSNMTPEQIQAEKLRRQKLQEEADLELAKETLGITDDDSLDGMNPRSKEDFVVFKDAICKKVLLYKKSDNFPVFVEELFRDLSAGLAVNELRKIKLNLDNMLTEKSKTEKSKKARGKGKAKLRVDDNIIYDEYSAYTVDDYDDFM